MTELVWTPGSTVLARVTETLRHLVQVPFSTAEHPWGSGLGSGPLTSRCEEPSHSDATGGVWGWPASLVPPVITVWLL